MIPVSLYALLHSGHPTSPCPLPPASQLPYQVACHFYKAPPLQEALQDCSAETAWLCLDKRWPFHCLCPSHEKDAKEEDWDVHTGAIQGPERVSHFPKASPQKANILLPVNPSPVTPGFSRRLCLSFPSLPSFSPPTRSLPYQQGTEVFHFSALGWAWRASLQRSKCSKHRFPKAKGQATEGEQQQWGLWWHSLL